ncbi:hypothetical protein AX17_007413 [Amanita inopinata Kibby_2008]|nr:hypothetical protein AX17_007413 [Amanita inopinata Kibby_2008]
MRTLSNISTVTATAGKLISGTIAGLHLPKRIPRQHQPVSTLFHLYSPSTFLISLKSPRILSNLLSHLEWSDFYSLANSCNDCRLLFDEQDLKDVILSRYVPGYAHALRLRDPFHRYKDVPVSIQDLDLLLISQRIPLHLYPIHALRVLTTTSPADIQEATRQTSRFIMLCTAHTRFVLLLQSYAHSSQDAMQPEPEEALWASHFGMPASRLRELTFPAPLSYSENQQPRSGPFIRKEGPRVSKNGATQSQNDTRTPRLMTSHGAFNPSLTPPPAASSQRQVFSEKSRTFPFLRKSSARLRPEPAPEFSAVSMYSKSWRRSSFVAQSRRSSMSYVSDGGLLVPPSHRPLQPTLSKHQSSESFPYSGSSPSPLSGSHYSVTLATGKSSTTGSESASAYTTPPSPGLRTPSLNTSYSAHAAYPVRMASPHDLSLAVSRARAPILRVFVPCSELEDGSAGLLMCEQQLIDAGLWDHLSAGDLVCNLGYVPPTEEMGLDASPSSDAEQESNRRYADDRKSSSNRTKGWPISLLHQPRSTYARKWLLFNGHFLVPYRPPNSIHLPDPLSLPTPFYYTHIMPPHTDTVFVLDRLGFKGDAEAAKSEVRLVQTRTRVRSPHSPVGYAVVKKHVWTVRFLRSQFFTEAGVSQELQSIGDGWLGEWVLEGEGTREGKRTLLDCLFGKMTGPMEWELVREQCSAGRVWLRLLSIIPRTAALDFDFNTTNVNP